ERLASSVRSERDRKSPKAGELRRCVLRAERRAARRAHDGGLRRGRRRFGGRARPLPRGDRAPPEGRDPPRQGARERTMSPVLLVVAGPNGSGKTTITARLREERWSHGVEYLNADDIARDRFGDWNSPEAVLAAAQWTTARRNELLTQQK